MKAKVKICWGSIKAWMEGGRRGEVDGRVKECGSVESSYSERVKGGMLEESMELVAGWGGGQREYRKSQGKQNEGLCGRERCRSGTQ